MNLTVEIPDDLVGQLNAAGGDLSRRALEALALEEYKSGHILQRVEAQLHKLNGEEKHDAANLCMIISAIMGIGAEVVKRIHMIDIMELEVIGPAIRQGIEQGIEQGKTLGTRGTLSRQLTLKFGPLPEHATARLDRATEAELSSWEERVLTARTLDEVFS
jgi:hypothetical protein